MITQTYLLYRHEEVIYLNLGLRLALKHWKSHDHAWAHLTTLGMHQPQLGSPGNPLKAEMLLSKDSDCYNQITHLSNKNSKDDFTYNYKGAAGNTTVTEYNSS